MKTTTKKTELVAMRIDRETKRILMATASGLGQTMTQFIMSALFEALGISAKAQRLVFFETPKGFGRRYKRKV